MLVCEGLETYYGPAHILFDVSLRVEEGQLACLLGRNGVGKTTCLRSIMGLTPPTAGSIRFEGGELVGLPAFRVARRGIGYVPEDRRVFAALSVEDNLAIGARGQAGGGWTIEDAFRTFPALEQFRTRLGGNLSGGQQQMLTIARTLMGNPRLLLIDEPTEGLSPIVIEALEQLILDLKRRGHTILLAAQNVEFALRVADRIYVMDRGRVVYSGDDIHGDAERIRSLLTV